MEILDSSRYIVHITHKSDQNLLGVEKNNDDAKRYYYSGNRHDAARDILITEGRIEHLQRETPSCVHDKRKYVKRQHEYWEHDITRAKRMNTSDDQ